MYDSHGNEMPAEAYSMLQEEFDQQLFMDEVELQHYQNE